MAITATLVLAGHNRLKYLIVATVGQGESVSIESDGGATPDLLTDSINGPLKAVVNVKAAGYGIIPAGGITTQAQARALLLSDNATSLVGSGVRTCTTRIEQRTGAPVSFVVDAVRGPSDQLSPGLTITANTTGASSCYLTILIDGVQGT